MVWLVQEVCVFQLVHTILLWCSSAPRWPDTYHVLCVIVLTHGNIIYYISAKFLWVVDHKDKD